MTQASNKQLDDGFVLDNSYINTTTTKKIIK
jgi:hypothetical protein